VAGVFARIGEEYEYFSLEDIQLHVIGILIALQINNWNEQRKDDKLEAE